MPDYSEDEKMDDWESQIAFWEWRKDGDWYLQFGKEKEKGNLDQFLLL